MRYGLALVPAPPAGHLADHVVPQVSAAEAGWAQTRPVTSRLMVAAMLTSAENERPLIRRGIAGLRPRCVDGLNDSSMLLDNPQTVDGDTRMQRFTKNKNDR